MRWSPRSLSVRLFFIVLGGVIVAIVISNFLHHHDRVRFIAEYREQHAVEHLLDVVHLLAPLPPSQRSTAIQSLPRDEWLTEPGDLVGNTQREATPAVTERLAQRLNKVAAVEGTWLERPGRCQDEMSDCSTSVVARIRFQEGQTLWLGYAPREPERFRNPKWMRFRDRDLFVIGVMALVAWIVVWIALRPLQKMAEASESFGRDINHPPIDETGPSEVRRAAQAFNTMQRQIRGYMSERTQILGAVTHDLKTPMTRMRLRLESCTDEVFKDKLQADLAAMQSLVEEGLELAHSLDIVESPQPVDFDALLQSLCDDAVEMGLDVAYRGTDEQRVVVKGQPKALRRVFENIIDNAIKYGHYARVRLERQGDMACAQIQDGGPGILEEYWETVLKPFVRLESSRSRETGGTGLGLAIAVNLLRIQQGEMTLRNLPQGGLEVSVRLPIAPVSE